MKGLIRISFIEGQCLVITNTWFTFLHFVDPRSHIRNLRLPLAKQPLYCDLHLGTNNHQHTFAKSTRSLISFVVFRLLYSDQRSPMKWAALKKDQWQTRLGLLFYQTENTRVRSCYAEHSIISSVNLFGGNVVINLLNPVVLCLLQWYFFSFW